MRLISLILFSLLLGRAASAQTDMAASANRIVKYIERNMMIPDSRSIHSAADFFIFDISIDTAGRITEIHCLILDSLSCKIQAYQLADSIKKKFIFPSSEYKKMLVPVMVIYPNEQDSIKQEIGPIVEIAQLFRFLNGQLGPADYVSRLATVMVLANSGKKAYSQTSDTTLNKLSVLLANFLKRV